MVQLNVNSVVRSNRLFGNRWERLCADLEIGIRQPMVLTNLGDHKLSLTVFLDNGTCLYREIVYPTMLRLPGRAIPFYAMEGSYNLIFNFVFEVDYIYCDKPFAGFECSCRQKSPSHLHMGRTCQPQ